MPDKRRILAPPATADTSIRQWAVEVANMLGTSPLKIQAFTVAELATKKLVPQNWGSIISTKEFSSIVFVTDEVGGPTLAFSDGTSWLRLRDNAIITT